MALDEIFQCLEGARGPEGKRFWGGFSLFIKERGKEVGTQLPVQSRDRNFEPEGNKERPLEKKMEGAS